MKIVKLAFAYNEVDMLHVYDGWIQVIKAV